MGAHLSGLCGRDTFQVVATSDGQQCRAERDAFAVYDTPHGVLAKLAFNPLDEFDYSTTGLPDYSATAFERTIVYNYDNLYRLTAANYAKYPVTKWSGLRRTLLPLHLRFGRQPLE